MPDQAAVPAIGDLSQAPAPTTFRQAMRHFPTAVAVLTIASPGGRQGMTANSVTSLSLQPELLLACVRQPSRFGSALRVSGGFVVNVLQEKQANIARWFASAARLNAKDEFAGVRWRPSADGHPVLTDASCVIECRIADLLPRGDHLVVTGEIALCSANPHARPLLWHQGGYHQLGDPVNDNPRRLQRS